MNPHLPIPLFSRAVRRNLALALSCSLGSPMALASTAGPDDPWLLCPQQELFSSYRPGLPSTGDRVTSPTTASASEFNVSDDEVYELTGEVEIQRADQLMQAPRLLFSKTAQTFESPEGMSYQDRGFLLQAQHAEGDLAADRSTLRHVDYVLLDRRGNGRADLANLTGEQAALQGVSYTTCDPGSKGWRFEAEHIDLDNAKGLGVARNARLHLGNVPVFYLPYVSFPTDDRRRSGFLYPIIGTGSNTGLDIRQPYYLNLAPNYDATITPRSLGRRGFMIGGEFRYLGEGFSGNIEADWLPNDDIRQRDRGSFRYRHVGQLDRNWQVRADLYRVSDDRYFEDLGDSLTSISTTLLESSTGIYGRGKGWTASALLRDFQLVDPLIDNAATPFRQLPQVRFDALMPTGLSTLQAGLRSELVAFDHTVRAAGQRLDLYPYLRTPIERSWGFLRPEIGYRYTHYSLDQDLSVDGKTPSRATPITSLDAGLLFERPARMFNRDLLQTLEPRLYYLRVPYREQDDLPLFDTQELSFSYAQLFRSNRFTGADRQMDANQLAAAISTRFFNADTGEERASATIGQIHYFDQQRVQLEPLAAPSVLEGSPYIADIQFNLTNRLSGGISTQWDGDNHNTQLSSVRGQYRFGREGVANLAYRFRRTTGEPVEQIDATALIPVSERWRLVGRWNYSLTDRTSLEAFGGVQWESCCMAVRVLGRHYVRNREGEKNNALYVEIELKGLGRFGRTSDELLQRAILGYTR
jgi:LPS-assembly protein